MDDASEYLLFPEHAGQRADRRDVHRGPAGLVERRGQELVRRHEREAGLRARLRRPRRPLQAGRKEARRRKKVRYTKKANDAKFYLNRSGLGIDISS